MMDYLQTFNYLPWHDALLLSLDVDRSNPGEMDVVRLAIEWPDGSKSRLLFEDCYLLEATMNFGIIALESILEADCSTDSNQLTDIRKTWKNSNFPFDDMLCFRINTNSTNSLITICALSFRFE